MYVNQNNQFLKKDLSIIAVSYKDVIEEIYIIEEIAYLHMLPILLPTFIIEISRGQELGL